jgi:hypothetical protein
LSSVERTRKEGILRREKRGEGKEGREEEEGRNIEEGKERRGLEDRKRGGGRTEY